jgi:ribulose kinase
MATQAFQDMCLQYLATIQALALGTRHIILEMNKVLNER